MMKVRKAVFPAAGLGTRFLPATKAQPKEMLPVVDKPIIQYGVEEAMASGCDQILIITGRGKQAIEDHFDVSYELEKMLEERRKTDLLKIVRNISDMMHVAYVRQKEALGLGHAVLMARELVGNEPFAVLLADDVIDAPRPLPQADGQRLRPETMLRHRRAGRRRQNDFFLRRLRCPARRGIQRTPLRDPQHGRKAEARGGPVQPGDHRPLHPDASDFRLPGENSDGRGGELQLTDGMRILLKQEKMYAYVYEGKRYDTGDKLGFLKATVEFALKRADLGGQFREYLKGLDL